jgi:hypothetical protein
MKRLRSISRHVLAVLALASAFCALAATPASAAPLRRRTTRTAVEEKPRSYVMSYVVVVVLAAVGTYAAVRPGRRVEEVKT